MLVAGKRGRKIQKMLDDCTPRFRVKMNVNWQARVLILIFQFRGYFFNTIFIEWCFQQKGMGKVPDTAFSFYGKIFLIFIFVHGLEGQFD